MVHEGYFTNTYFTAIPLELCGQTLSTISTVEYLGVEINSNLKPKEHIDQRITAALKASFALESRGLMYPEMLVDISIL